MAKFIADGQPPGSYLNDQPSRRRFTKVALMAARLAALGSIAPALAADTSNTPQRTQDTLIAELVEKNDSATRDALDNSYKIVLNVRDYGLKGDGRDENTGTLFSAIASVPSNRGTIVYFPSPEKHYVIHESLPNHSNITYQGDGMFATEVMWVGVPMLQTQRSLLKAVNFRDIWLVSYTGDLIDLETNGTGGGLSFGSFTNCFMQTLSATGSLVKCSGLATYQEMRHQGCHLRREAHSVVPAFNLSTDGATISAVSWSDCNVNSSGSTKGGPFIRGTIGAPGAGNRIYDWNLNNITGEKNPRGIIYAGSPDGLTLTNVTDYDTNHYVGPLVEIGTGNRGNGEVPRRIKIDNVGPRGQTPTYDAGNPHVRFSSTPADSIALSRIGDDSQGMVDAGGAKGTLSGAANVAIINGARISTDSWQTYTPGLAGNGASLGNGVTSGEFQRSGDSMCFTAKLVLGSTTVIGSALEIGIPAERATTSIISLSATATRTGVRAYRLPVSPGFTSGMTVLPFVPNADGTLAMTVSGTAPFPWRNGDVLEVSGIYQAL